MNKLLALVLAITALPLLEGCGDTTTPKRDARVSDGSTDGGPPRDTGTPSDRPTDQPMPPPPDAGMDAARDTGGDVSPSDARDGAPGDVARDAAEAGVDVAPADVARDVAREASVDMAPDTAAPDVSPDLAPDVAADVAPDVAPDVTVADMGTPVPDAGAGEQVFVAELSGASETPPVITTATGSFTMVLNAAKTEIRYNLKHNVSGANAAHLHTGSAGEQGGVAIAITPLSNDVTGTAAITPAQVADLEAGRLYVNVHSPAHSGGEIRGQVLRPGEAVFVATLTGAQENPPVATVATASGSFIVSAAKDSLRYRVALANISANAAHVHKAAAGVNGPVVFDLAPLNAVISGTTTLDAARLADLERGLWYANVHSPSHTGGEIRGQILREGEALYIARLTGASEVPAVVTTATGGVGLIVNAARTGARYDGAVSMITGTAAHIHAAMAGANGGVVYSLMLSGTTLAGNLALTASDLTALEGGGWYVNVHSAAYPDGEIRGQLGRP